MSLLRFTCGDYAAGHSEWSLTGSIIFVAPRTYELLRVLVFTGMRDCLNHR